VVVTQLAKALARALEIVGGAEPLPAALARRLVVRVALGAWWALLFLVVLAFAGRGTKFVYVDF
jgi:hypothetical protein